MIRYLDCDKNACNHRRICDASLKKNSKENVLFNEKIDSTSC